MCERSVENWAFKKFSTLELFLFICTCNRITDVSLKYAFSFLELRYLNLSHCQQVSFIRKFNIHLAYKWSWSVSYLLDNTVDISFLITFHVCVRGLLKTGLLKNFLLLNCFFLSVHFTFCSQVTHVGISELASKSPSIETLIMSNCHNITDDGVINSVKQWSRLKHLELQVCVTAIKP